MRRQTGDGRPWWVRNGLETHPLLYASEGFEKILAAQDRCGREDLNLHGFAPTWPSTMPVCLFQHARVLRRQRIPPSGCDRRGARAALYPPPIRVPHEAVGRGARDDLVN